MYALNFLNCTSSNSTIPSSTIKNCINPVSIKKIPTYRLLEPTRRLKSSVSTSRLQIADDSYPEKSQEDAYKFFFGRPTSLSGLQGTDFYGIVAAPLKKRCTARTVLYCTYRLPFTVSSTFRLPHIDSEALQCFTVQYLLNTHV